MKSRGHARWQGQCGQHSEGDDEGDIGDEMNKIVANKFLVEHGSWYRRWQWRTSSRGRYE